MIAPAATYRFAVAGEDWGHYRAATRLADRVLAEKIEWARDLLEHPELRETLRRWGLGPDERPWSRLKDAWDEARARRLPCYGHFNGEPREADARMLRAQLLLFQAEAVRGEKIDAVLLVRDLDDDPARSDGVRQVLALAWPFPVIIATCAPEIEAWYVAGFIPGTPGCRERLARERRLLGFSPPDEPHRLTSKRTPGAGDREKTRDAKAILRRLCAGDPGREAACLEVPLDLLRERGQLCGLTGFLADVEVVLVPLFVRPS